MCAFILGIAQFGSQVQKLGAELTINQKQQCDNEVQQNNSDEYKKKKKKEEHFLTLDWTHLQRRARSGFDLPAWRMSYGARKHLVLST